MKSRTYYVVWNQKGPVRVRDEGGTEWDAYVSLHEIPNLRDGPHIATIRGCLVSAEPPTREAPR